MGYTTEAWIIRCLGTFLVIASVITGIYYIGQLGKHHDNAASAMKNDDLFYCVQKSGVMNGYQCINNRCEKTILLDNNTTNTTCLTSFNVCQLLCESDFFWPVPTKNVTISNSLTRIDHKKIYFKNDITGDSKKLSTLLENLKENFVNIVTNLSQNSNSKDGRNIFVTFKCKNSSTILNQHTDESYEIKIETKNEKVYALINANTYFGVRHGIETLSQMILFDDVSNATVIPKDVFVADEPVYKYRGIMLDTGRSYYSVQSIKKTLDAMSMNKLNVLHWHIVDSPSFPLVLKQHTDMASIGAFSSDQVYTKNDLKDIKKYANVRGIRIIPELDVPSHVGEGWQHLNDTKSREPLMLCYNQHSQVNAASKISPLYGQLNPTLAGVYDLLADLYKELADSFEPDTFHTGGNDVNLACWNTTQINQWIGGNQSDVKDITQLHEYFYKRNIEKLKAIDKDMQLIVRDGPLTKASNLDQLDKNKFIVQIQSAKNNDDINVILKKGYNVIFSNDDVLNLSTQHVSPPVNVTAGDEQYRKIYYNDPLQLATNATSSNALTENQIKKQILGAEAILWSDESDSNTVDAKLWPRCAALAERLWSNPSATKKQWTHVKRRLMFHRQRMTSRNILADILEPIWCLQYPSRCFANNQ